MSDPMATVWAWCPPQPAYREQPAWLIRLTGPDSRRFLHGQTSATIELVAPGRWVRSCCIGPTARLLGLAEVLIDTEGAWLAITEGDGQRVRQALDRVLFPGERVELGQPEPARWLTPVPGGAEEAAAGADGEAEEGWVALADGQGWQLGRGPLGQALLLRPEAPLPSAWYQRQPLTAPEQERWRLQQGLPGAPGEVNEEHNPFELGLAERVSLAKGCYVGQETLARLATYDGVKQQLRRWFWRPQPGVAPPQRNDGLELAGDPQRQGRITSLLELENGARIGLALVRRSALGQPRLQCSEGGAELELSLPPAFQAPPGSSSNAS
jgi:folate-binding protein YgfZ